MLHNIGHNHKINGVWLNHHVCTTQPQLRSTTPQRVRTTVQSYVPPTNIQNLASSCIHPCVCVSTRHSQYKHNQSFARLPFIQLCTLTRLTQCTWGLIDGQHWESSLRQFLKFQNTKTTITTIQYYSRSISTIFFLYNCQKSSSTSNINHFRFQSGKCLH